MSAPTAPPRRATLDDLYGVEGKAELIQGSIIQSMASGYLPAQVASNIFVSLRAHAKSTGRGKALNDGLGYAVPELLSGRESFMPDASYHVGALPANRMRFIEGPPAFAVEVRSENDYIPSAEIEMATKRADYFEAGTLVVWDVDPIAETVAVYKSDAPNRPTVCRRGDMAEAEPAVMGWRMAVNEVFDV
jgi:Uma2 family endonuclease